MGDPIKDYGRAVAAAVFDAWAPALVRDTCDRIKLSADLDAIIASVPAPVMDARPERCAATWAGALCSREKGHTGHHNPDNAPWASAHRFREPAPVMQLVHVDEREDKTVITPLLPPDTTEPAPDDAVCGCRPEGIAKGCWYHDRPVAQPTPDIDPEVVRRALLSVECWGEPDYIVTIVAAAREYLRIVEGQK